MYRERQQSPEKANDGPFNRRDHAYVSGERRAR
jgi:hypothetical protein